MNEKIEFGIQNWNVEYRWWTPNTVPADFVYDGVKKLPLTHTHQWFDVGIVPDASKLDVWSYKPNKRDFLYHHHNVVYTHLSELKDKKYIYPVFIYNTSYFHQMKPYGLKFVDPTVINDVKQGRAKIVFMMQWEGTSGGEMPEDLDILDSWCKSAGLTTDQVYYISCNYGIDHLTKNKSFTHIPLNAFITWIPTQFDNIIPFVPTNTKYLFLMYSRQPRQHRIVAACELYKRNLMDRGIMSFWRPLDKQLKFELPQEAQDLIPAADELTKITPLEIDLELGHNNPAQVIVPAHYESTFLSVVSETIVKPNTAFFSEKIYKPLAVGHPFMLIGGYKQLEQLRKFGFHTFGKWFDERYDNEPDWQKRIKMIMSELKRLSNLPLQKLLLMREEMSNTLDFNQKLFNAYRAKYMAVNHEQPMYEQIEKIWLKFN